MAQFNQNGSLAGLGTYSVIVPSDGIYFVDGKVTLPTVVGGGGASSCVVTVNLNGAPKYVGSAGAEGFKTEFLCAASDTIAVVTSSAAAVDQPLNAIKTNVAIGQGT